MHRFLLALALALVSLSGSARADERYYLLMFGSQRLPRTPDNAHTFATFVKRCEGPNGVQLEVRTISWLPASEKIRTHALRPEAGRNFALDETIRFVQNDRQRVSLWGPYEIRPELFEMAGRQIEQLNAGRIRYKANDGLYRSDDATNCIHAVGVLATGNRRHLISPGWGDTASDTVLESLMPWVIGRTTTHDCVARELGLEKYAIAYRKVTEKPLIPVGSGLPLVLNDWIPKPTFGPPEIGRAHV